MLPADAAIVRALLGEPAEGEDGLDEVRAFRRRLGISAEGDRDVLGRIGRLVGAVAVVVVKRSPEPSLEVYDVGRAAYFADALAVDEADEATLRRFVLRRANAARAHASDGRAAGAARAAATAEPPAATGPDLEAGAEQPTERRRFLRRNIAYIAAGALLLGAGTFLLVDRLKDDPPPIVRIRPGGD